MPIRFQCVTCGGKGCDSCSDGVWELNECPRTMIDETTADAITYARYARSGFLPASGGMLDQTEWFTDACRMIWNEQDIIEMGMTGNG